MKKITILQSLQKEKENTKQLILTSVFLAIGVDSLTTGLLNLLGLDLQAHLMVFVGLLLVIVAIIYNLIYGISRLDKEAKFEGFVIYNSETKEIVPVNRYEVSEDMVKYLKAAFIENKAMKTLWDKEPINKFCFVGGKEGERVKAITTDSGALFIELMEYCIIEQLSLHLSSYFTNSNLKKTVELSRSDIPDILLDNRFMKLFSEDMKNRELFIEEFNEDTPLNGKIVSAYHSSGAVFNEFDLILPKKSRVKRISKNQILIETNMFSLSVMCLFGGFGAVLPRDFEKNYIGLANDGRFNSYSFNVEISIRFKFASFFFPSKWSYYNWADEFVERIEEYISNEAYFQHINWETASTIIRCQDIINKEKAMEGSENSLTSMRKQTKEE